MTKTNYQRVIEDIRSGRTELVWEDCTTAAGWDDAKLDDEFDISVSRQLLGCGIYFCGANTFAIHPLNEKIEENRTGDALGLPRIASTLEETKAKLQEIYNDYLLEEARKKDEGVVV